MRQSVLCSCVVHHSAIGKDLQQSQVLLVRATGQLCVKGDGVSVCVKGDGVRVRQRRMKTGQQNSKFDA